MAALKANIRSERGSRKARALRSQGLIPGVIYGHGEEVVAVTLGEHDIDLAIHHGQRLVQLDVDGKEENALIKDVQWDTFGQKVLHVDLTRVDLNERVEVTVPITLRGTPAGAVEGGVLQQNTMEVRIECMVRAIPEELRSFVGEMNVGDSLYLRDLELPEGATLVDGEATLVCSVSIIAEEAEEAPAEEVEEGAAQPEVIGEKTDEAAEGEKAEES